MSRGLRWRLASRSRAGAAALLSLLAASGCRTAQPEQPVCLVRYMAPPVMTYAPIEDRGAYFPNRREPSVVVVRVADASLRPMEGVLVSLQPGQTGGIADPLGAVRIEGVLPGRYEVRVMKIGYPSLVDSITHMPGGTNVAAVLAPGYRGLQECVIVPAAEPPETRRPLR